MEEGRGYAAELAGQEKTLRTGNREKTKMYVFAISVVGEASSSPAAPQPRRP